MTTSKLFQPIQVGTLTLSHRVVLAPSTRFRNDNDHVPLPHVAEYYSQRSKIPGTLLISEAAAVAPCAGGLPNIPGIWSEAQIASWKRVAEAVHANGSYIYLQLWAMGRSALYTELQKEDPPLPYVSASDIILDDEHQGPLRPLTIPEIKEYVRLYGVAAYNAVHRAGFDGVEIHNANGYLLDQFLQDVSNKRTDEYGGNEENRTRFSKEILGEVIRTVGPERTAIRFSPWGTNQGMLMDNPVPTFSHIVSWIRDNHLNISYIHLVEPRADWGNTVPMNSRLEGIFPLEHANNDFIRAIWGNRPLISTGGYDRATAFEVAEKKGDIIAFSRAFIANPDLPFRLKHDIPLTKGDRAMYYDIAGSFDPKGYTDYPFSKQFLESQHAARVTAHLGRSK